MKRLVLFGTVVGLAIATTGAVAYASGDSGTASPQHGFSHQSATPAVAPHAVPLDSASEQSYTSIAPCRAADTRLGGGQLSNGTVRSFAIGGASSFAGQGGPSAGCGVPAQATAVTATITVVATGKGYIKAWASGATQPLSSFMNYTNVFNAATGGTIPLGAGRASVADFGVKVHVIVDVTGYYIKPMYAFVNSTGTLGNSSRTVGVTKLGTGVYQVNFDRDVSRCAYAVTNYLYTGPVLAEPRTTDANAVFVEVANSTATLADGPFYLTVTC